VGHERGQVDPDAGVEAEVLRDFLHRGEVAFLVVVVAVELTLAHAVVLEGRDADVLHTPDLQQEAVLGVEVHRRVGRGRRDEEVARASPHASLAVRHDPIDLIEALVDELGVRRRLLDVAQGDSEAVALDVEDRRRRWPLADVDIPVTIEERKVSALAPDRRRREPVCQLGDRLHAEERVIDERVSYGDRSSCEQVAEPGGIDC
jgi:hypothetical protein